MNRRHDQGHRGARGAGRLASIAGILAVGALIATPVSPVPVSAAMDQAFKFNPGMALNDSSGSSTGAAEPTIKVDSAGHIYVAGPVGVPNGGCPWWSVHPDSLNTSGLPYDYLGKFDNFSASAFGGGDCDIATGGLAPQNNYDNVALSSLSLANVTVNQSSDGGKTLHGAPNPVGTPNSAGDDRQWNAADTGLGQVYMGVHDLSTDNIQINDSTDGGYTYVPNLPAIDATHMANGAAQNNVFGGPVINPTSHRIFIPFIAGASASDAANSILNTVYIAVGDPCAVSCTPGLPLGNISWTDYLVYGPVTAPTTLSYIFPSAAIDKGGNVYVSWSDSRHVYISHSTTPASGGPWSAPVVMDQGDAEHSAVMPSIVGGASGVVDAVWYAADYVKTGSTCPAGATGTPNDSNGLNNNCFNIWEVEFGQSRDFGATFQRHDVTERNHNGSLCTQGLNCSLNNGNRNLLDFFEVSLDPAGAANIAYASDLTGTVNLDYTRQCVGPSATTSLQIKYSCKGFLPVPKPPAPVCGNASLGHLATLATDPTGDAINPAGAPGSTSAVDITKVQASSDGTNLTTTLTISTLTSPVQPINGTGDSYYYVAWQFGGQWYATLDSEPDPGGPGEFTYGTFNPSTDQLTASNTAVSGTITAGTPGTIAITVPLSGVGNPAIPVTVANAANAAMQTPFGVAISGEGALGTGLVFTHPDDRAPNQGYGSNWSVC